MLDGGGLNPDLFTDDWKQYGLPMPYANLFLPMPDDSNKYVLFHQVADYNAPVGLDALEIYYSNVDLSMNGGLGQVISKNNIALMQDLCMVLMLFALLLELEKTLI